MMHLSGEAPGPQSALDNASSGTMAGARLYIDCSCEISNQKSCCPVLRACRQRKQRMHSRAPALQRSGRD